MPIILPYRLKMADKFDDMFHIDGLVRGTITPEARLKYFKSLSDEGKQAYISHVTLPILNQMVEPELYTFWASLRTSSKEFDLSRVFLNEDDQAIVRSGVDKNLIKYLRTFGFSLLGDFGDSKDKDKNKDAKKDLLGIVNSHDNFALRPFPGYPEVGEETSHVIYMNIEVPPKIFKDNLDYLLQFISKGPDIQGRPVHAITYHEATEAFMKKQEKTKTEMKAKINLMRAAAALAMGTLGYLSIKANGKEIKIHQQPLLVVPEYLYFGVFPELERSTHGPRFVSKHSPGFELFQNKARQYLTTKNGT